VREGIASAVGVVVREGAARAAVTVRVGAAGAAQALTPSTRSSRSEMRVVLRVKVMEVGDGG